MRYGSLLANGAKKKLRDGKVQTRKSFLEFFFFFSEMLIYSWKIFGEISIPKQTH